MLETSSQVSFHFKSTHFATNQNVIYSHLYDFGQYLSKPQGECVCLPFQQAVAFLGSFQSSLHLSEGPASKQYTNQTLTYSSKTHITYILEGKTLILSFPDIPRPQYLEKGLLKLFQSTRRLAL